MAHVATLTIDHTKVDADLTDFPVAVIANGDAGWAELYAVATEGGGDIRVFKSDDTTELPREIVTFSVIAETGEIHIKYSGTLSSTVDTDIHIYADGTSSDYAVTATYGRNAVWSNFAAVWHLGSSVDSTGNGYTLTANGGITFGGATGKLGDASDFDGTDDSGSTGQIDPSTSLSVTSWIKSDVINAGQVQIAEQWNTSITARSWMLQLQGDGSGNQQIRSYMSSTGAFQSANVAIGTTNITIGNWFHASAVYDGGGGTLKVYTNGVLEDTTSVPSSIYNGASNTHIGNNATGALYFDGIIDETRVSKTLEHSDNWITAEYNNQNSPATFYSVTAIGGAVEQALTATAQASAEFVREVQKEMSITAQATADFTRSVGRILTATAQATANFVRQLGRTLSVTAQASPTLQAGLLYVQELLATAQATASIAYTQVTIVAMTATAQATATVGRIQSLLRDITATAQATALVNTLKTFSKIITATASATASIVQSGLIISRELIVTASATITMTVRKTLSQVMSVTVGSVVSLLKDYGYIDKYPENDATYEDKYPE